MGTEKEARALAAGDFVEVEENGVVTKYTLRPIVVQNLCDLERMALNDYKRSYLSTYSDNRDLMEAAGMDASSLMMQKLEEVACWDLGNLPQKEAFSVQNVPLDGKAGKRLRQWVKENHGEIPDSKSSLQAILVNALDTGKLKPDEIEKMTGTSPIKGMVRYDQWWVTASFNGMVAFITASVRYDHPELNPEKVSRWPMAKIIEASNLVERLTSPTLGNG